MGRRIRTAVSQSNAMLAADYLSGRIWKSSGRKMQILRGNRKNSFNSCHGAKGHPKIPEDFEVWVTSEDKPISSKMWLQVKRRDHKWWRQTLESSTETGAILLSHTNQSETPHLRMRLSHSNNPKLLHLPEGSWLESGLEQYPAPRETGLKADVVWTIHEMWCDVMTLNKV